MGGSAHLVTTIGEIRRYLDQRRWASEGLGESALDPLTVHTGWDGNRSGFPEPQGQLVGFVPTMGALHEGHLSLIQRARQENDVVVVSIFVNPLQFGPHEDFQRYPRTLERDSRLCDTAGVDVLFVPSSGELYGVPTPDGQIGGGVLSGEVQTAEVPQAEIPTSEGLFFPSEHFLADDLADAPTEDRMNDLTLVVPPPSLTGQLCGRSRTGHFQGVATVVTKFLQIVQPHRAYFGQKDAQQLAIIQRVVQDLNIPVTIVACPIVRDGDGLALSSRNQYLSPSERQQATVIYRSLKQAIQRFRGGQDDRPTLLQAVESVLETEPSVQLEYVALVHPQTLQPLDRVREAGLLAIAARVGATRLIDNVILRQRQPIVAIDGPAGAGKSTVTRLVAHALGLLHLDTGAMYRAVTWLALHLGIEPDDERAIAHMMQSCQIRLVPSESIEVPTTVLINNHNVTQAIRGQEVTAQVSTIAAQSGVRRALVQQQQSYGKAGGIVAEGRDIGTYVFPDADLKIFLTASVQERARRRQQDLQQQGTQTIALQALEKAIAERDSKDRNRLISPLRPAWDAIELSTDHLTVREVTEKIVNLYQATLKPT